jgi:hypothetical protein
VVTVNPLSALIVATVAATSSPNTADALIATAGHQAELLRDEVLWRSTFVVDTRTMPLDEHLRVRFAYPLAPDALVSVEDGALERDGSGRPVAVVFRRAALSPPAYRARGSVRTLSLGVTQPIDGRGDVVLRPPFALGKAVQRVTLSSPEGLTFRVSDALPIERRIGSTVGADVDRDARRATDRTLGDADGRLGAERLYLRASPALVDAGGVRGELLLAPAKRRGLALAVGAAFAALLALGSALYRRFARAAELERAEAILEAEWGGLGG